jgi:hypothetical protein
MFYRQGLMGDGQSGVYGYFEELKQTYFYMNINMSAAVAKQHADEMLLLLSQEERRKSLERFLAISREDIKSPPATVAPYLYSYYSACTQSPCLFWAILSFAVLHPTELPVTSQ